MQGSPSRVHQIRGNAITANSLRSMKNIRRGNYSSGADADGLMIQENYYVSEKTTPRKRAVGMHQTSSSSGRTKSTKSLGVSPLKDNNKMQLS